MANCFVFHTRMKHDCFDQSECENGVQCTQDHAKRPKILTFICPRWYFLNAIWIQFVCIWCFIRCCFRYSYSISWDYLSLTSYYQNEFCYDHYSRWIRFDEWISFKCNVLSRNKTRQVGCGFYLLTTSMTSIPTMTILAVKFIILIMAQMNLLTNGHFLNFQCHTIVFLAL